MLDLKILKCMLAILISEWGRKWIIFAFGILVLVIRMVDLCMCDWIVFFLFCCDCFFLQNCVFACRCRWICLKHEWRNLELRGEVDLREVMGQDKVGVKSGGFFHLFDWNHKSRKKLFSNATNSQGNFPMLS